MQLTRRDRLVHWIVGALWAVACAGPQSASAQPASPTAGQGSVQGVVFSSAHYPQPGVEISLGQHRVVVSNEDGAFSARVQSGQIAVTITFSGERWAAGQVQVLPGETTEVLLTLQTGGPPTMLVEQPTRETPQKAPGMQVPLIIVRGQLVDTRGNQPVKGARIFARGTAAEASSINDGTFRIDLPAGPQTLTIIHPEYSTERFQLHVQPGMEESPLQIKLDPAAVLLADLNVLAPRITGGAAGLLEVRRQASSINEVIGAEQMRKSGDTDSAAALGRVPGITVVGGRYVYIRGLGERYSSTVLNLSTLPSPEPERRVVPLDIFPVGVLEEITIQKTYTPDLPGDFSGGMVKLETQGFPTQFSASLGTSVGFNDGSVFRSVPMSKGQTGDFLTFGASARQLPTAIQAAATRGTIQEYNRLTNPGGYRPEELEALGEGLSQHWDTPSGRLPPDLGLSGSLGDSFQVAGLPAGYLFSMGYANTWRRVVRESLLPNVMMGARQSLEIFDDLRAEEVLHEVKLSGIGVAGIDLAGKRHTLRLTALIVRDGEDETRQIEGFDRDANTNKQGTRLWYRERMLLFNQLVGQHMLLPFSEQRPFGLQLDWRYAFSMAISNEPDRRSTRYDQEGSGSFELSSRPDGNQRFFSELQDTNHDLSLDLTGTLRQWSGLATKVKTGLNFALGDREVDTRRFRFSGRPADPTLLGLDPEQLFIPERINGDEFQLEENTRATDNYRALHRSWAAYLMGDLPFWPSLSLLTGVRVEFSYREVITADPFAAETLPIYGPCSKEQVEECTDLPDPVVDLLPALILSYRPLGPRHVFRLGYSRTLNRPQIRELSPAPFDDPDTGVQYEGNPRLRQALLDNVDLRWEWYPSRMESISVAAFYKHFTDPIETVAITSAAVTITPDNARGADNLGLELEVSQRLAFLHRRLRDVTLGGNASMIFSRVSLDPLTATAVTNQTRPLQGQSPWVFNFFLSYDNADSGTVVRLLYNVFGPRIAAVGTNGVPDTYEQPFHRLDLVASQRLWNRLSLAIKACNLIDHQARWTLEDEKSGETFLVDGFRRGREFTLSLTVSY